MMALIAMPASKANSSLWADSHQRLSTNTTPASSYDVAIIGGGFSGLWSAFHLISANPSLRIAIFEERQVGFGASGRNGGWVSSEYPVSKARLIKQYGTSTSKNLKRAIHQSIDEIGAFANTHVKSAGFTKSGSLYFARNRAQLSRLRQAVDGDHHFLNQSELGDLIEIKGALAGVMNPNSATVNPYELLLGLAGYLEAVGISIFSGFRATPIAGGVLVNASSVAAEVVIQATEAFGDPNRDFIPLYSLMVATERLPDSFWKQVGNHQRFTFAENSHLVNYAQRTTDGRLAIGGRGATYPFGSRLIEAKESTYRVHEQIKALAKSWFPDLSEFQFTHHWGGPVAITRDWEPYVIWDQAQSFGRLGGYAGDGMTLSYLAAKSLVNEVLKLGYERLHFVNRKFKNWEFEPLRYLAVNAMVKLSGISDSEERLTGRASLLERAISPVTLR